MAKIVVLSEYCKSCGLCIEACPKQVLAQGEKTNAKGYFPVTPVKTEECIGCGLCATMCPDIAIEIYR